MAKAVIVGWGHTRFGRLDSADLPALLGAAAVEAIGHAGIAPSDVEQIMVGAYGHGFSRQGFASALVAVAEPALAAVPATRLENACATGSAALHAALDFVESGRGRIALAVGGEKMTATPPADIAEIMLTGCYREEEEAIAGSAGFAGIFGHVAGLYFERYGDRSRELGMIAAKNHGNGVRNPLAHFRKDLGVEFCATVSDANPRIAGPLRKTDCSPISDGAAAIVVAEESVARAMPRSIALRARRQANDHLPLSRRDPLAFEGARRAWAGALADAGVSIGDLDLVETHDCFTIAEMIEYEAMGLAAAGEGWKVVREGTAERTGALPVNPSGGLKARGHPIGATGLSQHIMCAQQLCGEAGDMQLPRVELAGVFNMGGMAVANYVSILERTR
jgi:acetyl-CoA C-acetyltransferase